MRTLVVTNAYPTAARPHTGIFVQEQVESLEAAGADVRVLHVDRSTNGRSVYRNLGPTLRAAAQESDADVVHVMYGGVLARVVANTLRETPLVVSFCGNDLLGEGEAPFAQRLAGRYSVWCSHVAARRARAIVVKSKVLRDALPGDVDRAKVTVIPNGVDLMRFVPMDRAAARGRLGWSQETRHVLFPAARDRPEKRFQLARAAVEEARRNGVPVELHELDGVARDDVPIWLNASDAVLLTSTHEGSPNVVKEALACDVPVVSVDVGDVRERIAGVAGCHIAAATPGNLGSKLVLALSEERPDARRAVEEIALPRVAERLEAIYESVSAR